MNLEKLKDTARKHEQKEDWRKAIDVYQRAIDHFETGKEGDADLTLYNRVGDLYLKLNNPGEAVRAYERAAELYADQGFLNNAIALCGKVLRVNPGRTEVYLRLAHLHARKNVVSEAKRNLIEYIERLHGARRLDEAFKNVQGFSEQHGGNADIRSMLIELLRAAARSENVGPELERLAAELEDRDDGGAGRRSRERMSLADTASAPASPSKSDLIFIETGFERFARSAAKDVVPIIEPPPEAEPAAADSLEGLETIGGGEERTETDPVPSPIEGLASDETGLILDVPPLEPIEDLELGEFEGPDVPTEIPSLDGLVLKAAPGFELTADPDAESPAAVDTDEFSIEHSNIEPIVFGPGGLGGEEIVVTGDASDSLTSELEVDLSGMPSPSAARARYLDDFDVGDLGEFEDDEETAEDADLGAPWETDDAELATGGDTASADEDTDAEAEIAAEGDETAEADDVWNAPVANGIPSIEALEDRILDNPDDADAHRALADRLIDEGDSERAAEELLLGIGAFAGAGAWDEALDAVDVLVNIDPDRVSFQQKRVEIAYRSGLRNRLTTAYLGLADALVRAAADDKAAAVYRRVLEHEPDNSDARDALEWIGRAQQLAASSRAAAEEPSNSDDAATPDIEEFQAGPSGTAANRPLLAVPGAARSSSESSSDFIDLGSLIMDAEGPRDTRMRVDQDQPTGDEQKDFLETLEQFKKGIEANLGSEDYEAHYDLGIAFKEMGLYDEAIAEFQKALRAPDGRLRTSEALGITFFEKQQFAIAETILRRAIDSLAGGDDEKIALLYWLGRAAEAQGKAPAARGAYERALAVDIRFMDLNERIRRLTAVGDA